MTELERFSSEALLEELTRRGLKGKATFPKPNPCKVCGNREPYHEPKDHFYSAEELLTDIDGLTEFADGGNRA